jgi:hypothetical protein
LKNSPVARRCTSFHVSSLNSASPGNSAAGPPWLRRSARRRSTFETVCSRAMNIAGTSWLRAGRVSNTTSGASSGTVVGRSTR